MDNILSLKKIYKSFGEVKVLEGVDFSLEKGQVKGLLGANGAGKSTLIKIIGGVHRPTQGEMYIRGEAFAVKNENAAKELGISIIYQELSLIPTLSVIENIFLGREIKKGAFLDEVEMKKRYYDICEEFDFQIDGDKKVSDLSIAEQQMIEIMKAISCDTEIIIMDEPTTSLTNKEKEGLYRIIKKLKSMNKSIIYISHLLDEVLQLCDRASIMQNGFMVGDYDIGELDKKIITQLMTGEEGCEVIEKKAWSYADYKSPPRLVLENASSKQVQNINLSVFPGEVLGIAGLVGSKRTEIIKMIYGIDKMREGTIKINEKEVIVKTPKHAIKNRIGLIPEDRKNLGLVLGHEIYKNMTTVQINKYKKYGLLCKQQELEFSNNCVEKLGIKISELTQPVKELSGGNQQKVVVSKWLDNNLELIIYDEPTKGIDISAKEDIFATIEEFAKQGVGVIFISSDLEEVIRISDKILVVRNGKVVSELLNENLVVQDIMNKIFDV